MGAWRSLMKWSDYMGRDPHYRVYSLSRSLGDLFTQPDVPIQSRPTSSNHVSGQRVVATKHWGSLIKPVASRYHRWRWSIIWSIMWTPPWCRAITDAVPAPAP